jgi:ribosomal protein S18 acetylase RimI-like enzyme
MRQRLFPLSGPGQTRKNHVMPLRIRELTGDREITAAFPLMRQLRDRLREETFLSEVRRQQSEGYRVFGGFEGERLVALAGVRRTHTLARGEHLFVDDLVTEEGARGRGHGRELLLEVARRVASEGLSKIHLDSRITAKGFYERLGFHFHTSIPSWIEIQELLGGA